MREEISYGRLMMMGDEERAEYLASQMSVDSNGLIQVEDNFMDDIIPPGMQVDLVKQWNEISLAMGLPTCIDDIVQDGLTTIEVYRIRNQRSPGDELLDRIGGKEIQIDFTDPRQSPIRAIGETEVRHFIPDPSTVSHAQREPAEWAKKFVWGNNSAPLPKKESTARIWHERKPVPVLEHVEFGNEGFMDDIRHAYAESVGIEAYEVNIDVEEVIYI